MALSYNKKAEGVATVTMPFGDTQPVKTATCGHCQKLINVAKQEAQAGGVNVCHCCWSIVCGPCHARGRCTPWEKQMEQIEARDRALRSYGLEGVA